VFQRLGDVEHSSSLGAMWPNLHQVRHSSLTSDFSYVLRRVRFGLQLACWSWDFLFADAAKPRQTEAKISNRALSRPRNQASMTLLERSVIFREVHHQEGLIDEMLEIDGLGPCSVAVMLRTGLFPHCRSRQRNTTPSPPWFFVCLAESFRQALANKKWRLPSLKQCYAVFCRDETDDAPSSKRSRPA
jgi:hypothetical protein